MQIEREISQQSELFEYSLTAKKSERWHEVIPVHLGDSGETGRAIAAFARSGGGGLIVTVSALLVVDHYLIITLAIRHKLPAVCRRVEGRYLYVGGGCSA